MKKGFFEYDPVIYPRKLWVHIGENIKWLCETFEGVDIDESVEYSGCTLDKVSRKDNNKYGVLVSFQSKKDMTMGIIAHEASHVVDAIEEATGIDHGDEPSAYLMGWVASCINKARLGQGEFIEIKEQENRV